MRLNGQTWTCHIPEGAVVKTELYTHFIWDQNGLHTYHFSYGQGITDWGNADDQVEPLQAIDNQEEAYGQGKYMANNTKDLMLYWKRVSEAMHSISDGQQKETEITSSTSYIYMH